MYNVHNVKLNNVNNWINILELEKNISKYEPGHYVQMS